MDRPGDDSSPELNRLRAALAAEPAAAALREREAAFDAAFAGALRTAPVPTGLRAEILARVARAGAPASTAGGWAAPFRLLSAAGAFLALVLALTLYLGGPRSLEASLPPLAQRLVVDVHELLSGPYELGVLSPDLADLQAYLAARGAPLPETVPSPLAEIPTWGCLDFEWEGGRVSMVCFHGERTVHVLTTDRSNFPSVRDLPAPVLFTREDRFTREGRSFAVWTTAEKLYVATSDEGGLTELAGDLGLAK